MKTSWSKILFIASDIVIGAYLVLAFTSFDKKGDTKAICSKVNIDIADNSTGGFLDAKVIKERLQKTGNYPIGKPLASVNTRGIEEMLRQSPFVKTAECYKTEGGHVYISVTQRMPVIRIKADNGDDYYVDDHDCIMPRTNYTSDLIIASGNIGRRFAIRYISPLGKAIMQNDMWKNLIEQINILPNYGVEIIPRVGDHIVYLGKLPDAKDTKDREKAIADFVDRKMTRLEKFYRYGLSQVGWNKYSYVNLEFDNQIICKKKHSTSTTAEPAPEATPVPAANSQNAQDGPSEGETREPVNSTAEPAEKTKTNTQQNKEQSQTSAKKEPTPSKKKEATPSRKADATQKKADAAKNRDTGKTQKTSQVTKKKTTI